MRAKQFPQTEPHWPITSYEIIYHLPLVSFFQQSLLFTQFSLNVFPNVFEHLYTFLNTAYNLSDFGDKIEAVAADKGTENVQG